MILEELRIERQAYGVDKGKFKGSMRFANATGRIEMQLTHDLSERLLKIVGESLVDSAKELATTLTSQCIDALPEPERQPSFFSRLTS
jgi:hypothetical protein